MTEPNKPEGHPRDEDDTSDDTGGRDTLSGAEGPAGDEAKEIEAAGDGSRPEDADAPPLTDDATGSGIDDGTEESLATRDDQIGDDQAGDAPTGEDPVGDDRTGDDGIDPALTDPAPTDPAPTDLAPTDLAETDDPALGMAEPVDPLAEETTGRAEGAATEAPEMVEARAEPTSDTATERDIDTDTDIRTTRETDAVGSIDPAAAAAAGGALAAASLREGTRDGDPGARDTAAPKAVEPVIVEKRGGFLPGFFGGILAVAGAVFAAPYVLPEAMRPVMSLAPVEADLAAQSATAAEQGAAIEALSSDLSDLSGTVPSTDDIGALDDDLSALRGDLTALRTDLDGLLAQMEDLTRRPVDESLDPEVAAALESYNSEVSELTETVEQRLAAAERAMAAQTEENRRMIEEASTAAEAALADAEAEAAAAAAEAEAAMRSQAVVDVQQALENGEPFAEALAPLDPALVPAALSDAAETGVPTLAALQEGFSEPARAALDAARRADMPADPYDRVGTFFQTQLGMRSLAPRDGNSADAVLSRAEAALRSAEITTALEEIGNLPDIAQQEMAGWVAEASARAEAIAAADELAATLATN